MLGQGIEERRELCDIGGFENVRFLRTGTAHLNVVPDGAGIHGGLLQDTADVLPDHAPVDLRSADAVEEDLSFGRQTEGQQQLHKRTFAAARAADDGDLLPRQDVHADVLHGGLRRALIAEGHMVEGDFAPERVLRAFGCLLHPCSVENFADAVRRDLGVRQHDHREAAHQNAVGDKCQILDDSKDIAAGDGVAACLHAPAADPYDRHARKIHKQHGRRTQKSHLHVGVDDVLGHDVRRVGDLLLQACFLIKCADDADAVQALAHDVVLNVDVLVGRFVQGADPFADGPDDQKDRRDEQQQDQAHHHVLAQRQNDAAEKQHRDRNETAGDHRRDPGDRSDIVSRPGQERGSADGVEFLERHIVDEGKHVRSQVGVEARDHIAADLPPGQKRGKASRRNGQHPRAAAHDIRKVRLPDAVIQNVVHDRRQQQIAHRRRRDQQHRQRNAPAVRLQIRQDILHEWLSFLSVVHFPEDSLDFHYSMANKRSQVSFLF